MGDDRIMMRSPQGIRIHFFLSGQLQAIWHALQRILWRQQSVLHIIPMLRDHCQGQLTDRYGSAAFVRELKYMVLSGSLRIYRSFYFAPFLVSLSFARLSESPGFFRCFIYSNYECVCQERVKIKDSSMIFIQFVSLFHLHFLSEHPFVPSNTPIITVLFRKEILTPLLSHNPLYFFHRIFLPLYIVIFPISFRLLLRLL